MAELLDQLRTMWMPQDWPGRLKEGRGGETDPSERQQDRKPAERKIAGDPSGLDY